MRTAGPAALEMHRLCARPTAHAYLVGMELGPDDVVCATRVVASRSLFIPSSMYCTHDPHTAMPGLFTLLST